MRASDLARYILQAGAFGASGDAEAVKARIALLGLNARVQSAVIHGKTVYCVRLGPYGTATELASAKAKLAHGGLRSEERRLGTGWLITCSSPGMPNTQKQKKKPH